MKLFAGVTSALKAEFAWPSGDSPGNLDFRYEPPGPIIKVLKRALAPSFVPARAPGVRIRALFPSNGPVGRYRLSTQGGSWFIRVSSRFGNPELEKSITDYLVSQGGNVNPLIVAGETLQWNGQSFRVDVRPLIEGRHFNGSSEDLRNLAFTLAVCHHALKDFPRSREISTIASARNQRLAKIRERIAESLKHGKFDLFAEHASWAVAQKDWLAEMVEKFDPHLEERRGAQCVHGEIHLANVLFRARDGAAVLVDFEESVHSFKPPIWDLGFVVQRFCLRDHPLQSVVLERAVVLAESYGSPLPDLAPMMRQAAWSTMATIIDMRIFKGVSTPISEYNKFVRLERQGRSFEGLL